MSEWYFSRDGQSYGPYDMGTMQGMISSRQLGPADMVWRQGMTDWVPASQVKGLFPPPPRAPMKTSPEPATYQVANAPRPQPVHQQPGAYQQAPHQQAAYPTSAYPPPGYQQQAYSPAAAVRMEKRNVVPFMVVAILLCIAGVVLTIQSFIGRTEFGHEKTNLAVTLIATGAFILLCIPALIMWLTWVHRAHKYIRSLSQHQSGITPGQAVGYCFIPLFDAFWAIYMPYRLAGRVNEHLQSRQLQPIASGVILGCQITSVVTAFFLPGLLPVLYAITMWQIQAGIDRLHN